MSKLTAFLNPVSVNDEQDVVVSRRFRGEDGQPVPFRVRAVSQSENDRITRLCRRSAKVGGAAQEYLDTVDYHRRLVLAGTVEPDFSSRELCQAYGTMDPLEVPGKMLYSGEYRKLVNAILEVSGFTGGDVEAEAKN